MRIGIKGRIILACLFAFFVLGSVFADTTTYSSLGFQLVHNVNVSKSYYCEFWEPGTEDKITSRNFTGDGVYTFATLAVWYDSTVVGVGLSVAFTDLIHTEDLTSTYSYQMTIYPPNTTSNPFSVTPASGGHGAGSAVLLTSETLTHDQQKAWNSMEIADFVITLNGEEEAIAGNYSATITFTLTGP